MEAGQLHNSALSKQRPPERVDVSLAHTESTLKWAHFYSSKSRLDGTSTQWATFRLSLFVRWPLANRQLTPGQRVRVLQTFPSSPVRTECRARSAAKLSLNRHSIGF